MCLLGYRDCGALGLFLPLLLSRFQRHLLSSVFGGVSRVLLSLLAKPCCVCPPSGIRHLEAVERMRTLSLAPESKLPLQQPKVLLSLLFSVQSLSFWVRHFPRSQLILKVGSRLCCGLCRKGWERSGTGKLSSFPAPLTPQKGPRAAPSLWVVAAGAGGDVGQPWGSLTGNCSVGLPFSLHERSISAVNAPG